jgi:CRP/FNR family transcriptional regulator
VRSLLQIPHSYGFEELLIRKRKILRNQAVNYYETKERFLRVIRLGQFKRINRDERGVDRVAGFYFSGDILGLDTLNGGPAESRFSALEDSYVCEFTMGALNTILHHEPGLARQFLFEFSRYLRREYKNAAILSISSIDLRFVTFVSSVYQTCLNSGIGADVFFLTMSRTDIASYLGTTSETISRVIARCNAEGSILIKGKTVEVRNVEFLMSMLPLISGKS